MTSQLENKSSEACGAQTQPCEQLEVLSYVSTDYPGPAAQKPLLRDLNDSLEYSEGTSSLGECVPRRHRAGPGKVLVGGLMTPVSNAERAWHGWNNGLGHMEGVHHTPAGGRGEQGPPRHVAPTPHGRCSFHTGRLHYLE
ncbi:hypothetical protein CapIbe_019941 [Capra ibex]